MKLVCAFIMIRSSVITNYSILNTQATSSTTHAVFSVGRIILEVRSFITVTQGAKLCKRNHHSCGSSMYPWRIHWLLFVRRNLSGPVPDICNPCHRQVRVSANIGDHPTPRLRKGLFALRIRVGVSSTLPLRDICPCLSSSVVFATPEMWRDSQGF